ncbi:helix-turn-helix domain-containing protein [Parvibaculum sp.]|uniref:helix-turn-helix domain-containing protein n=1 Tax=Parvibaculum sp. TaxID=2024848 RepID=UPI002B81557B|nr:helix-turn-helix domain-containing protein [Parvibaculum sp.]HUD51303.1 helix-turn-helix domain-containing protein [Parvibaculum sp.]
MLESEIGMALRAARVEKGLSVAEISRRLHLKEAYVEAIERGESGALFPRSYLIGFLRSMERLLTIDIGADIDALARVLREEREGTVPPVPLVVERRRVNRAQIIALGGFMLVLCVIFSIGHSSEAPIAEPLTADEVLAGLKAQRHLVVAPVASAAPAASVVAAQVPAAPTQTSAPVSTPAPAAQDTLDAVVTPAPAPTVAEATAEMAPTEPSVVAAETASPPVPLATPTAAKSMVEPANASAQSGTASAEETKVVTRAVYLRERPSKNSDRIGTVARCTRVTVEQVDMRSGWVEINDGSGTGYVHQTFLSDAMPACGPLPAEH